ncbi:hypothetical protein LUX39_45795 [Actinomadura madurae]|nr:hypothetical protein [Actinomadura madurae]MCP9971419.1 hypothetical protein [Actinomadura madurae]MCQ0020142.1 hypothetical protein [Actinomadura madurae]
MLRKLRGQDLGRRVVGEQPRLGRYLQLLEPFGGDARVGQVLLADDGVNGVDRCLLRLLHVGLGDATLNGDIGDVGLCLVAQHRLGGPDRCRHRREHLGLAVAGAEGDDGEQVGGLAPAARLHPDLAAGGDRQDGQGEAPGQIGRGLGLLGQPGAVLGEPVRQHRQRELWQLPRGLQRGRRRPATGVRCGDLLHGRGDRTA